MPLQVFAASFHPSQQSVALSTDFSEAFQDLRSRQDTNGGKPSHGFDDYRAYKQARTELQFKSELSEENLRQLDEDNLRELDTSSDMGAQSIGSMSQITGGKSSGPTIPPAAYRFNLLDNARTHLRWGHPPDIIQNYINSIIKAQSPKDIMLELTESFEKRNFTNLQQQNFDLANKTASDLDRGKLRVLASEA